MTKDHYQVVTWHGESNTLFYVVDTTVPEAEQPHVILTFNTADGETRSEADITCQALNKQPLR